MSRMLEASLTNIDKDRKSAEGKRRLSMIARLHYAPIVQQDYYSILGLQPNASVTEIRHAYRDLTKTWHPDKQKGNAEAENTFRKINEAYEVLGNPERKAHYDRTGAITGESTDMDFSRFGSSVFEHQNLGGDLFETALGGDSSSHYC